MVGCAGPTVAAPQPTTPRPTTAAAPTLSPLAAARRGFTTRLTSDANAHEPLQPAPPDVFTTLTYAASPGPLAAYATPVRDDGVRRPAIVWITGGDCNTINDMWSPRRPDNDQTASQFRSAGVVMMFPSLRGGDENPGRKEGFLGEVDDVLAAAAYLATRPDVDPKRVFLGGHSTGGTLALLVAEVPGPFRAVFAFGPVADVSGYEDPALTPIDLNDRTEVRLRSPGYWLDGVLTPTWVIEGDTDGNLSALEWMRSHTTNPKLRFVVVPGKNHFSVLAVTNATLAADIVKDSGSGPFVVRIAS